MLFLLRFHFFATLALLSFPFASAACLNGSLSIIIPPIDADVEALLESVPIIGDATGYLASWNAANVTEACCWAGVTCNLVDGKQRVISVYLYDRGLIGTLPPSFWKLTALGELGLSLNNLSGNLSESLGNLKKLTALYLTGNNFTGNLPESLESLTGLRYLLLGGNNLAGDLTGRLESLTKMFWLDLRKNRFYGNLPSSWGTFTDLSYLYLDGNNLSGNLPISWGNLTNLVDLLLDDNNLTGKLPESWKGLTNLTYLYLGGNNLSGDLPISLGDLTKLITLNFSGNSLTGSLLKSWESFTALETLDLSGNSFTGNLSESLGNLSKLKVMDLSGNILTGNIPESWENLTELTNLDLSANKLTGNLSKSLGSLTKLTYLNLSGNNLIGDLLESWGNLTECYKISYAGIPIWNNISSLPAIKELDLSKNMLSGGIPFAFLCSATLTTLNLRGNLFSSFSRSIGDLEISPSLTILNVGSNSLTEMPKWNTSYNRVREVYFDNNNITGAIPSSLGNFSFLQVLDLSNNLFDSEIPDSFGSDGVVYDSLLNLYRFSSFYGLSHLNLSRCGLSGEIPIEFGALRALSILDLSFNNLTGNVTLIGSPALHTLDLSSNKLSGELPPSLGGLDLMFLSLSNNELSGRVPEYYFNNENSLTACANFFPGNNLAAKCNDSSGFLVNDPLPPPPSPSDDLPQFVIPTAIVGSALFVLVAASVIYLCVFKKKTVDFISKNINEHAVKFLPLQVISEATDNFSGSNELGAGGFGIVYRGIAKNGQVWAVKRAKKASVESLEQFKNEVETISRMNHKNLVKLIGFFHSDSEQILVYEFIENGTLKSALKRREDIVQPVLTFEQRLDIALGAAEGLRYLHTQAKPTIIHRDVKSDNILLDAKMQAKVCDFGLLKDNEDQEELAKRTSVAGTYGYMDPEYYTTYKVTTKSDVYSFGVVLLELVTGQPAIFEEITTSGDRERTSLSHWAPKMMRSTLGLSAIVDPSLESDYSLDDMNALASIAASCLQKVSKYRPEMADVASHLRILKTKMEKENMQVIENNGVTILPSEEGVEEEGPLHPVLSTTSSSKNIYSNTMSLNSFYRPVQQESVLLPR